MISIQLLTRNLRRVASLRGLSNANFSTKTNIAGENAVKNSDKSGKNKSSGSSKLFDQIKSMDQASASQTTTIITEKVPPPPSKPKTKSTPSKQNAIPSEIADAKTVPQLLKLCEKDLNQTNAMSILTKLSTLTASNQATVSDFENDYRFLKICRILSKIPHQTKPKAFASAISSQQQKSAELEMILSVAGDDEASQIVQTLSLPQKVKVLSSLARKKTRSPYVLKSLASSIISNNANLNIKECSDILYAMISLNFIDTMLLERIKPDICVGLTKNLDRVAVVGSIVTSLGLMKYKDATLLDNLSQFMVEKHNLCRPKDLASLILTLALVNYRPQNIADIASKLIPKISQTDLSPTEWLDYVWALCILESYQSSHLESVLRPEFLGHFSREQKVELSPAEKMKLLNVNAVATQLATDYKGPLLDSKSSVYVYPFGYRKSKNVMVQGLLDTLTNLFTSNSYIRTEYDMKMGFIIDAECVLSENRTPLAIESTAQNAKKVAFMVLDYHDMCRGQENEPNGIQSLAIKLLEKNGYTVLPVPYNEFSTREKVLKRVQYLDAKLKNIFK